jgi:TRAP-type C4-dicarboxylate transport system permease small subunit
MLAWFERLLEIFCTAFGLTLGAIVVLLCTDVLLRDLGLGSLPWLIELSEYLMYGGTFLAAPWVLRRGSHVRVDILLVALPRRLAVRMEQLVDTVGLGISLVLLYYGAAAAADAYRDHMVQYKTWYVPEWLLLLPIPVCCALLAVEFVLRASRVRGVVSGQHNIADRPSL